MTIDRPRCDALTAKGERCRREGSYPAVVDADGREVNLCGVHNKMRRQGQRLELVANGEEPSINTPHEGPEET